MAIRPKPNISLSEIVTRENVSIFKWVRVGKWNSWKRYGVDGGEFLHSARLATFAKYNFTHPAKPPRFLEVLTRHRHCEARFWTSEVGISHQTALIDPQVKLEAVVNELWTARSGQSGHKRTVQYFLYAHIHFSKYTRGTWCIHMYIWGKVHVLKTADQRRSWVWSTL